MATILIIRACAVGDFVVNLPALRALQEAAGGASFTLVGYPDTLQLARDFINVHAIHSIDQEPWRRLFYEPLGGLHFERAIVWMKNPVVAENLLRSGVGNVLRADPFPVAGHAATHLLNSVNMPAPPFPDRWKPTAGRILLHPGSGSPGKCWPHFRGLADRLGSVAFVLGPAERGFDPGPHPAVQDLPLREVSGQLTAARGFVGNDSGITHLAAYLGCPTIALFGPTDPAMWGPAGSRVRILRQPELERIAIDEVCDVIRGWSVPSKR